MPDPVKPIPWGPIPISLEVKAGEAIMLCTPEGESNYNFIIRIYILWIHISSVQKREGEGKHLGIERR